MYSTRTECWRSARICSNACKSPSAPVLHRFSVLSLPQATTRRADCSDADARRSAAARPARSHTTTTSAAAVLHQSTARRRDSRRRSTRAATNPAIIHNEQRAVSQLSHLLNNRLIQSLSSISVKYSNKEDFTVLTVQQPLS